MLKRFAHGSFVVGLLLFAFQCAVASPVDTYLPLGPFNLCLPGNSGLIFVPSDQDAPALHSEFCLNAFDAGIVM